MNEQSIKEVEDRISEVVDGLLDDIEEGQKRDKYIDDKMAYASKLLGVLTYLRRLHKIDPV